MPANLIEALVSWADNEPALVGEFGGSIYNTFAPTGESTPLPYLTFVQSESRTVTTIGKSKSVIWYTVHIETRALTAELAGQLGGIVRDLLVPPGADPLSPLLWSGGREAGRYLTEGEGGELEDGRGPDGSDVWVHRIPIVFTTARG